MRFKKIYIETTNLCNLNCDFCIKNRRKKEIMTIQNFKIILSKIKNYTNYIYLHILGEPLLNPKLNEFILLASNEGFNINITTNGYLIDKIKDNKNIRQVNISLHSFDVKYNVELKKYLNNIFDSVEELIKNDTYVSLRLWVKNKYSEDIINEVNNYYKVNITKNTKIKENIININLPVHSNFFLFIICFYCVVFILFSFKHFFILSAKKSPAESARIKINDFI